MNLESFDRESWLVETLRDEPNHDLGRTPVDRLNDKDENKTAHLSHNLPIVYQLIGRLGDEGKSFHRDQRQNLHHEPDQIPILAKYQPRVNDLHQESRAREQLNDCHR